jgi:hypothetical protein
VASPENPVPPKIPLLGSLGREWRERDGVAQLLQALDVVALGALDVALLEVVGAGLGAGLPVVNGFCSRSTRFQPVNCQCSLDVLEQ